MQRILAFDEPPTRPEEDPAEEFELVVGRRQIAALTFLGLVMIALCSGASYLTGKAMSVREEPAPLVIQLEQPPAPAAPVIEAAIAPAPVPVVQTQPQSAAHITPPKPAAELPLFSSTVSQAIYIQVGAVEKGVATVIAEGLRKHALDSFVAPGPSEKTFRVLIGPFPNAEAYQKAQNVVDQIGLASFARRYQAQ
jgi:cell division septation protein DedD